MSSNSVPEFTVEVRVPRGITNDQYATVFDKDILMNAMMNETITGDAFVGLSVETEDPIVDMFEWIVGEFSDCSADGKYFVSK